MATACENISFVARRLIQFEFRFAQAEQKRRAEASKLFSQIGGAIKTLALELDRDKLPHDPCRDLIFFASQLLPATLEELGETEAQRLANILGDSSNKEKLYLEFRAAENKNHMIEELEKAHILIHALANGIYVPANDKMELDKE